jgi:predicted ATP-dependent serine protease
MKYYCRECSYRGKKSGQSGECPACGSFNIGQGKHKVEKKKPNGTLRLVILIVLWTFLIAVIVRKLST